MVKKRLWSRMIGVITSIAVITSGLVALPSAAYATEPEPVEPPTTATLIVDEVDTTTATLKATLDKPLENSQSTLSLYKTGDPITQQTATTGDEVYFTVTRPTNTEYEEYYVAVGPVISNTSIVNKPNSTWTIEISTPNNKYSYTTDDTNPSFNWETNQALDSTGKSIYTIQKFDGSILQSVNYGSQGSFNIPMFRTGPPVEYYFVIADTNQYATNETQLTNIDTKSSSARFSRAPWTIELSTNKTSFATDESSPTLTWETNQPILYYNYSPSYAVYILDVEADQIIATFLYGPTTTATQDVRFYTEESKTYVAYVALYTHTKVYNSLNDLEDIQASSNSVSISRTPWTLTIGIDEDEFSTDSPTPIITWLTNQPLTNTNNKYSVYIADQESGEIFANFNFNSDGSSAIPRFYTGEERTYIAYVAKASNYQIWYSNVSQLEDIQATSNTVSTNRIAWEVIITDVDKPIFTTDDPAPKIFWQSNQSLHGSNNNYMAFLVDNTNGDVINYTNVGTSGELSINKFYSGNPRTYQIYIAKANSYWQSYTNVSQFEDIQAISNSVSIGRAEWAVAIDIDKQVFTTDDATPKVYWQTNQSLLANGQSYAIYLIDLNTEKIIASSSGSLYGNVSAGEFVIDRFYTGGDHTYQAYIAKSGPVGYDPNYVAPQYLDDLEDVQAYSGTVATERAEWEISIGIDRTIFSTDDPSPQVFWSTNQSIQGSSYKYIVYLVDLTTRDIVASSTKPAYSDVHSGGQYSVRFETGDGHAYKAFVAEGGPIGYDPNYVWPTKLEDLKDIQAESNVVSTKRANWNISLNLIDAVPYNFEDEDSENDEIEYTLLWTTNQSIKNNPYTYYIFNGTYRAYSNVSWNWTGNSMTAKVRLPATVQSNFVAYVAPREEYGQYFSSAAELDDIQAISTTVNPSEISQEFLNRRYMGGGNPSEGNCNQQCYGDPVNSFNGEFFENETDLAISSAIPFEFARSYSTSNLNEDGAFGYGWTYNYNMHLTGDQTTLTSSGRIEITQENGSITKFTKAVSNGEEKYIAPASTLAELEYDEDNNYFVFTRRNNTSFIFDSTTGKLTQIKDLNNNYLNFTYTNGSLTSIENNLGKTLTIQWQGNHIASITDGTRTVNYEYNPTHNNLEIVSFPDVAGTKQYIYDTDYTITGIVHPNGGAYHNVYDNEKRVIEQTNPLQQVTEFEYDNHTTSITMPDGTVIQEIYSPVGQLVQKKFAVGTNLETTYEYRYDYTGQVSEEYGPDGLIAYYTHDYYGNTISTTNPLYQTYHFTYNTKNQLVETTNPAGKKSYNTYDANGNLIATTSYAGRITQYEVNSNGSNAAIISPNDVANETGKKTLFGYDINGHVNSAITPEGASVSMVNDIFGNPLLFTDSIGQTVEYTYDAYLNLIQVENTNTTTETEYDIAGRVVKETDVFGKTAEYTYDLMNQIISIETELGTVEYEYDENNRLTKQINIDGTEQTYVYDILGRLISTVDPNLNETTYTYYSNSRLQSTTDALNNTTTYYYDAIGNPIRVVDADNNETTAVYDNLNRVTSTTASNGYNETYEYDNDSYLIKTTKAGIEITQYEYDKNGNLTKTTYPDSSTEERFYNADGQLVSVKDRDDKITTNTFNTAGQLIKTTRPDTTEVEYSYTAQGQLEEVSYDNWVTIESSYEYDIYGRIISETKNSIETTYSYDAIGNMTRRGPPTGNGVEYEYDSYGKLESLTYPSGLTLTYTYDNNGNLLTVEYNNSTIAEYTYNAVNNPTKVEYGNGTFEEYEYDVLNQLAEITVKNTTGELYNRQLDRNSVGFIIAAQSNINNATTVEDKTYTYTSLQRLQNATDNLNTSTNSYTYDSSSNLISSPQGTNTFTANGQITTNVNNNISVAYTHDSRGNRTNATYTDTTTSAVSKEINYSWTPTNKLSKYASVEETTTSNAVRTDTTNIDYAYDSLGLLSQRLYSKVSRVESPAGSTSSSNFSVDYYQWNILSGIPTLLEDNDNNYVYGLGSTPVAQIKKNNYNSSGIEYLHSDERGSIVAATLNNGQLSWTKTYDEYGSTVATLPNGIQLQVKTPFAYAGEYLDNETGLYNLRARWYEPETGSFLAQDPALLQTGEAYSYASANPLSNTDPLGLMTATDWNRVLTSGFFGALDALSFDTASKLANSAFPGLVNPCTPAYGVGNEIGNFAANFIPFEKGLIIAAKGMGTVIGIAGTAYGKTLANTSKIAKNNEPLPAGYGGRVTKTENIQKNRDQTIRELNYRSQNNQLNFGLYKDLTTVVTPRVKQTELNHIPQFAYWKGNNNYPNATHGNTAVIPMAYHDHRGLSTTGTHIGKKERDAGVSIEEIITRDIVEIKTSTVGGELGYYDTSLNQLIAYYKTQDINLNIIVKPGGVYRV